MGYDSTHRQAIGYVQGMSSIASHLLWHAGSEEQASRVFVAMMQHYGLRCMFEAPDMHGLKMLSFIVSQLLLEAMPDLGEHLAEHLQNKLGVALADWLVTIFATSVPLDPLALFWDFFFEEGYTAVYRLILARLRCLRPFLLRETDFGNLVRLIKSTHVEFDFSSGTPTASVPQSIAHDSGMMQPAWLCLCCNGSASCSSWQTLVAVCLCQGNELSDIIGKLPRELQTYFTTLKTENSRLACELGKVQSELSTARSELVEARR